MGAKPVFNAKAVGPPKVDVSTDLPGGKPGGDLPGGGLPGVKPGGDLPGGKPPVTGGKKPSPQKAEVDNIKGKSGEDIQKIVKKTLNGKNIDEIAADPKVIDAAKKNKDRLKKLAVVGAVGLAALMIIYGESNPIEAIKKAMEDAGETFGDATNMFGDFFKKIIDGMKKFGLFIFFGGFIFIILLIFAPMIFRMLFRPATQAARVAPPQPYSQKLNSYPPR
jgi:hypothetical protein